MSFKKQLKLLVTPPVFEGDEEKTATAIILHRVLLYLAVILLIASIFLLPFFIARSQIKVIELLVFFLFVVWAWFLMERGKVRLASVLLVSGLWISATIGLSYSNSPNTFFVSRYVSITVIAGLLLGPRFSTGVAILSSASLFVIGILDRYHLLPEPHQTPFLIAWIILTLILILTALLLNLAQKTIKNGILKARFELEERRKAEERNIKLQEQLSQAQKLESIGRLAAGIAHDFNNLLTPIAGYADLIQRKISPNDPNRESLERINQAAERASNLTKQLLAFGRKQDLHLAPLDLGRLVMEFVPFIRRTIPESIKIETMVTPSFHHIKADKGQIEQVLLNLAINAKDAMPAGGLLTIIASEVTVDESMLNENPDCNTGLYINLSIGDSGIGMDKATIDRIFEPFFTTKPEGKGTGLGLATVYSIVQQHRGFLKVYSEIGHGSLFKVYFPAIDIGPTEKVTAFKPGEILDGHDELVLVVDDDQMVREVTCSILEHLSFRVISAKSGEEALACVKNQGLNFKLLVTDVILPGISGYDLSKHFQLERPYLKTLFMSGYTGNALPKGSIGDEIILIEKPFSSITLSQKIKEVLLISR